MPCDRCIVSCKEGRGVEEGKGDSRETGYRAQAMQRIRAIGWGMGIYNRAGVCLGQGGHSQRKLASEVPTSVWGRSVARNHLRLRLERTFGDHLRLQLRC